MVNAFTVDVEDYFQVSAFERYIPRHEWDHWESRLWPTPTAFSGCSTGITSKPRSSSLAGWRRHPKLVEEIHAKGHEIGSHGYGTG